MVSFPETDIDPNFHLKKIKQGVNVFPMTRHLKWSNEQFHPGNYTGRKLLLMPLLCTSKRHLGGDKSELYWRSYL